MAFPTALNSQITDAVTQSNVKVVGEAPAMAMANVYQAMSHSIGISMQNAVGQQQQQNTLAQAASTQGVMQMYSIDTASGGKVTQMILQALINQQQNN